MSHVVEGSSISATKEGAGILLRTLKRGKEEEDYRRPRMGDLCLIHYDCYLLEDDDDNKIPTTTTTRNNNNNNNNNSNPSSSIPPKRKVDSTKDRQQPLQFEMGANHVIPGLEVAVSHMTMGQIVEVTIPHLYAYGSKGHYPEIPPRSNLLFVNLELVDILPKQQG